VGLFSTCGETPGAFESVNLIMEKRMRVVGGSCGGKPHAACKGVSLTTEKSGRNTIKTGGLIFQTVGKIVGGCRKSGGWG